MRRFIAPIGGFAAVASLASVLIGVIVLRSPDTHANLWESAEIGYDRTSLGVVGTETGDVELSLDAPRSGWGDGLSVEPGRSLFLSRGCGTCHGLDARGGPVGPSLAGSTPKTVEHMVRDGPGGMPAYTEAHLSNADVAELAAYVQRLNVVMPGPAEIAAIQRLSWDPSVSRSVLLQGKAAVRRSCGACHTQPDEAEIRRAFATDFDATSLVAAMAARQTSLDLEEARAIAFYMMAVLHGVEVVEVP